jgi:hypothetical protein
MTRSGGIWTTEGIAERRQESEQVDVSALRRGSYRKPNKER